MQDLGSGGFGQTFIAEDTHMPSKRRCVIKVLHPASNNPPNLHKLISERFEREAAVLETLGESIDQIPRLYAYFEESGEYYLVQELIEGHTLGEKTLKYGPMNEAAGREFLSSFLNLLDKVHSQGIIHRDIKPNNVIMRARDGKPVLIDFGIVKEAVSLSVDRTGNTRTVNFGTPGYAPYEQARGKPIFASDLYSLGVTTIYALTGNPPGEMIDPTSGDIQWRGHVSSVSPEFAAIIDKSIEPNYRDRYRTAREMLESMRSLAPIEPPQPSSPKDDVDKTIRVYFSEAEKLADEGVRKREAQKQEVIPQLHQKRPFGEKDKERNLEHANPPTLPFGLQAQRQDNKIAGFTDTVPLGEGATAQIPGRPNKRRIAWLMMWIGISSIVILLFVIMITRNRESSPDLNPGPPRNVAAADSGSKPPSSTGSPAVEAIRYNYEIEGVRGRKTEFEPFDFNKRIKFHFTTHESGRLYMIGPDKDLRPTVFLSANPNPKTGTRTNKTEAETDFGFPQEWFHFDPKTEAITFTVVFLSDRRSWEGQEITKLLDSSESERKRAEFKIIAPADLERIKKDKLVADRAENQSVIRVPASMVGDEVKPLVFDITLKRRTGG